MTDKIEINGELFSTGLIEPPSMESALPMYVGAGPMWSKSQINEAISNRRPAVEVFGSNWIKNQNGVGACAGYAAASAVERARHKRGLEFVELSGDAIYAAVNGGRDRGSALEANMKWLRDNGVPPAEGVPRHEYRKNRIPASAYKEGKRFRGFEVYALNHEEEMASALAAGFIVVIACHAGNGGRSPDGLIDWKNGVGNHSVVCDDIRIRNGEYEYEIANSWGTRWGNNGRGWLTWNRHLSNPNKHHLFYAIRSTIDDPQGDNPPSPQE